MFFKVGDEEVDDNTEFETSVAHEDFLPMETCCSWGLKPRFDDNLEATDESILLADLACPLPITYQNTVWEGDRDG